MIYSIKNIIVLIIIINIFINLNSCTEKKIIIYEEEINIHNYEKKLLSDYEEVEYINLDNVKIIENSNFEFCTFEEKQENLIKYNPWIINKKNGDDINLKNIFDKLLLNNLYGSVIYFGFQGPVNNLELIDKSTMIANSMFDYYDPFLDKQVPSIRIFKNKDDYIIFYYFYFPPNIAFHQPEFYPLLSLEAFKEILEKAKNDYIKTSDDIYLNFESLYRLKDNEINEKYDENFGKYFSNEPENFYFLGKYDNAMSVYFSLKINFFNKYGYTMQDARNEYKKFGFVGYNPKLVIIPMNINLNNEKLEININNKNIYYSSEIVKEGFYLEYAFSSELLNSDWIEIIS